MTWGGPLTSRWGAFGPVAPVRLVLSYCSSGLLYDLGVSPRFSLESFLHLLVVSHCSSVLSHDLEVSSGFSLESYYGWPQHLEMR